MVASLMAIAAPAGAVIATDNACPDSIPSAGFTDLAGVPDAAVDAIDCIAFYDISTGTSATTFDPFADVERWQMALFLTRQAEVHGVDLPDGSDQGFTDLAGVPAAAVIAINQTAQLGISTGTSATTFDPFSEVERWQMALFITRLVDAAGVTLPDGSDQGFEDLAGVPAAAVTAINQLAQLEISEGTGPTTFDPFTSVARWAMALFLTRTLEADGITPPADSQVTVSPATTASLSQGTARAYSVTFENADGTPYSGFVGIQLVEVSSGSPVYNSAATDAVIETADGSAVGTAEFNGFPGVDGKVDFVVRHSSGTAETTIPVAWIDEDADSGYETTGNVAPTEPFGLGGAVSFSATPATEAADGAEDGVVVVSVNAAGDSFVGDRDTDGTVANRTYNYDSNDLFFIAGAISTQAAFEAALSETDVVDVVYDDDAAGTSTFDLVTDNTATASLAITDPSSSVEVDRSNYEIDGTSEPGYVIRIFTDADDNGAVNGTDSVVAQVTANSSGVWSAIVPLAQNQANNFTATQAATASATQSAPVNVPTINEGAPAAPTIAATTAAANGGTAGILDAGDVITLDFSESMQAPASGDTISLTDEDGTTAVLTCGTDATCTATDADTITVTISAVFATGGTTGGIQPSARIDSMTGFTGTDGNDVNVGSSGVARIIGDGTPVGDTF